MNNPKSVARAKTQSRKLILKTEYLRLCGLARGNFSDVSISKNRSYFIFTNSTEIFMKTDTRNQTTVLSRWTRFFGLMLAVVMIVHAAAMSQSTTVNLGTAGNFVILAKTGVSTTGVTAITGAVGISPAAASFITGFGLIADASNTFSTSSLVTGKVYASNYAPPTPTNMTTAISDMQTAYTDAAGRNLPDSIEMGAGDITSKTITHGL